MLLLLLPPPALRCLLMIVVLAAGNGTCGLLAIIGLMLVVLAVVAGIRAMFAASVAHIYINDVYV